MFYHPSFPTCLTPLQPNYVPATVCSYSQRRVELLGKPEKGKGVYLLNYQTLPILFHRPLS